VKDKFIRRSLIKLGYEAINSGYITNIPLENMLNDFENKLLLTMKLRHKNYLAVQNYLTKFFRTKRKIVGSIIRSGFRIL
jgi:replicative DNA helicase